MANDIIRVESFPFDSRQSGYDSDGYPVYDRAVGAEVFRACLSRIFTDGVFGTPADALQIKKGDSGLTVTVNPGIFIIKGAMGGLPSGSDPLVLTLDESAPQGNTCYSIMLRLDDNEAYRSLYIRVVKGESAANPQPTYPDQTSLNVMEYRLGYVIVPNGASDLDGATVVNEKGFEVCPYTAPFESIDVSEVLEDVDNQARDALSFLLQYFETYRGLLDSAIDGTTAEYLQQQINNLNTLGLVDNMTLGATSNGKMEVKDQGITTEKIKDGTILPQDLGTYLQYVIGIIDTTSWSFEDYDSFIQSMGDADQKKFIEENMTPASIKSWEPSEVVQFENHCGTTAGQTFVSSMVDLSKWSWNDLSIIAGEVKESSAGSFVGKEKSATCGTYGTLAFKVIGARHDDKVAGGKAPLTFMSSKMIGQYFWNGDNGSSPTLAPATMSYGESAIRTWLNNTFMGQMERELQDAVKGVKKTSASGNWSASNKPEFGEDTYVYHESNENVWLMSVSEYYGMDYSNGYIHPDMYIYIHFANEGGRYDYWSRTSNKAMQTTSGLTNVHSCTRSKSDSSVFSVYNLSNGTLGLQRTSSYPNGVPTPGHPITEGGFYFSPCFCI